MIGANHIFAIDNFGINLGGRAGYSLQYFHKSELDNSEIESAIPLSAIVELKFNPFFLIQTEFQYTIMLDTIYDYNILQVPLLARYSFPPIFFIFSPFIGIAYNSWREYSQSLPLSGIIGVEVSKNISKSFIVFTDFRYIGDFGKYGYGWNKSSFDASLGIKYSLFPFMQNRGK
jgi:hypothetical protein